MKKSAFMLLLTAMLISMAACGKTELPSEPETQAPAETSVPAQSEETKADFSGWDDVVELVNQRGDTATVYLLADGTYMDRFERIFVYDGNEVWMCGDEEWNRAPETEPADPGEPAVSIERVIERFLNQRPDAEIFEDSTGEFAEKYVFWAIDDLRDFRYQEISVDVTENGELICKEKKDLFTRESLTPEDVLVISLQIDGTIPNRAIEYLDSDGVSHFYAVTMSGYDETLLLMPLTCG